MENELKTNIKRFEKIIQLYKHTALKMFKVRNMTNIRNLKTNKKERKQEMIKT